MASVGGKNKPQGDGDKKGDSPKHKPLTMNSEKETREDRDKDAAATREFNEKYGVGQKGNGDSGNGEDKK